MKKYALTLYQVEFEKQPTHENVYEMLWSGDSNGTILKWYDSLEEASKDLKHYTSTINRQERYAIPGYLWVGEIYLVEAYETNGAEDPWFWQPLDVELEAAEDFDDPKATLEDLIEDGDVIDGNEDEDVELIRIIDDKLNTTTVLVYHRDTPNQEIYVLSDIQGSYPGTMEEVEYYTWIRAEDAEW